MKSFSWTINKVLLLGTSNVTKHQYINVQNSWIELLCIGPSIGPESALLLRYLADDVTNITDQNGGWSLIRRFLHFIYNKDIKKRTLTSGRPLETLFCNTAYRPRGSLDNSKHDFVCCWPLRPCSRPSRPKTENRKRKPILRWRNKSIGLDFRLKEIAITKSSHAREN